MGSANGNGGTPPNSTVGNVHSSRPIGAVTPNASPSGRPASKQGAAKKPPVVKRAPTAKKGKR